MKFEFWVATALIGSDAAHGGDTTFNHSTTVSANGQYQLTVHKEGMDNGYKKSWLGADFSVTVMLVEAPADWQELQVARQRRRDLLKVQALRKKAQSSGCCAAKPVPAEDDAAGGRKVPKGACTTRPSPGELKVEPVVEGHLTARLRKGERGFGARAASTH